jgi:hypothetical protein
MFMARLKNDALNDPSSTEETSENVPEQVTAGDVKEESQPSGSSETRENSEQISLKRRMPDRLRKYLIRVGSGKFYLPAAYRIVWFRDEYPDWGVVTNLIEGGHGAGFATVQATIQNAEGRIIASGLKTESRQDFPGGWVEKAETGAISRALAVAGFGTQFAPDLDEESNHQDVNSSGKPGELEPHHARPADRTAQSASRMDKKGNPDIWKGPGQCPDCHAPEGKPHSRTCKNAME